MNKRGGLSPWKMNGPVWSIHGAWLREGRKGIILTGYNGWLDWIVRIFYLGSTRYEVYVPNEYLSKLIVITLSSPRTRNEMLLDGGVLLLDSFLKFLVVSPFSML